MGEQVSQAEDLGYRPMHRLFLGWVGRRGLAVATAILIILTLPWSLSSLPGSQQETVECFQGF